MYENLNVKIILEVKRIFEYAAHKTARKILPDDKRI
jgi:hypothetical protein